MLLGDLDIAVEMSTVVGSKITNGDEILDGGQDDLPRYQKASALLIVSWVSLGVYWYNRL